MKTAKNPVITVEKYARVFGRILLAYLPVHSRNFLIRCAWLIDKLAQLLNYDSE